MDETEIRKWATLYDESFDGDLHQIEQSLHEAFQEQEYITQDQLREVVKWKLNNQGGRQRGNIARLNQVPDKYIRRVSEAALLVNDPKVQIETLSSIPGIGYATATVVLAFYDPKTYAVGDRYMVDVLLGEERPMRATDYSKLLTELRDRNPGEFDLRTVEKAYYQRYREGQGLM